VKFRSALLQELLVVVAAGNDGPEPGTISSPCTAKNVLCVGASDVDGELASYSSRGPTSAMLQKPDIVAPGNHFISKNEFMANP
jgi:subtilisin family serine protease